MKVKVGLTKLVLFAVEREKRRGKIVKNRFHFLYLCMF